MPKLTTLSCQLWSNVVPMLEAQYFLSGIKYVHVSFSVSLWSFSVSFRSYSVSFQSFSVSFRFFLVLFGVYSYRYSGMFGGTLYEQTSNRSVAWRNGRFKNK